MFVNPFKPNPIITKASRYTAHLILFAIILLTVALTVAFAQSGKWQTIGVGESVTVDNIVIVYYSNTNSAPSVPATQIEGSSETFRNFGVNAAEGTEHIGSYLISASSITTEIEEYLDFDPQGRTVAIKMIDDTHAKVMLK